MGKYIDISKNIKECGIKLYIIVRHETIAPSILVIKN